MKSRISENRRVTLSIGQLKKLIHESIQNDEDFEIKDGELVEYHGKGGDVVIPDVVTSIGCHAFYNCHGVTSVIIPNSMTNIGFEAFSRCFGLKSVMIPNSVKSIEEAAFADCWSLKSVEIPDCMTRIERDAFFECKSLTFVTIPDSVTYIGMNAFTRCSGLKSVTIGNGVTSIGDGAFKDCNRLRSIVVSNEEQRDMIFDGDNELPNSVRIVVKGEDSDDADVVVREESESADPIDEAFKRGVHSCAEDIEAGIKDLLQYYTIPSYSHQCDEFRFAFEQVKDVLPFVRALIAHTDA